MSEPITPDQRLEIAKGQLARAQGELDEASNPMRPGTPEIITILRLHVSVTTLGVVMLDAIQSLQGFAESSGATRDAVDEFAANLRGKGIGGTDDVG